MTPPVRYTASSFSLRAAAFGLAALVSLALLAGVGATADRQYDQALAAQDSSGQPTQLARQASAERSAGG